MKLQGKVGVVTGAAQGLGRTIAVAMAEEGADIVACDIQADKLADVAGEIEARGRQCLPVSCDVSDSAAVREMFARTRSPVRHRTHPGQQRCSGTELPAEEERRNRQYAHLTTPTPRRSLGITSDLTDEDWLKWWDVNVHGTFYCTREALKFMQAQQYGRIINIASIAGVSAASTHSPGYSASKAAVASFTKTVALDVAGANICVNAIACGAVMTPPFEEYLARATDQQRNSLYQIIPLGRLGRPDEYASLAVYLAGDSHYLVGQVISPNGGVVI